MAAAAVRRTAHPAAPGHAGPRRFRIPPGQFDDPEVKEALDEACARIKAKGLLLGTYAENHFEDWKRRGVDYMSVKNDTNAMMDGFRSAQAVARGAMR